MAWDSSRTVPWRRLIREWLIYVTLAIVAAVIYFKIKDKPIQVGLFAGLLASGPMYLLCGGVLAKFGIQRKTLKQLREERPIAVATRSSRGRSASVAPPTRNRPAPTKRTSSGPSQYRKNNKPKRR
jgi:hypothetical protein